MTMGLWVDIVVPHDAVAGAYSQGLRLQAIIAGSTKTIFEVEIALNVEAFALPLTPALKNAIQLDAAHLYRSFPSNNESQMKRLYLQYARWMLSEVRLNPGSIYDTWTKGNFREYNSPFLLEAGDVKDLVELLGMNFVTLPCAPLNQTTSFARELIAMSSSTADLLSCYSFDEVDNVTSPAIPALFGPVRRAIPSALTLTTAHIGTQYQGLVPEPLPFAPQTLRALQVTAVCPQTNWIPPKANITAVQEAGFQVWTYISMQPYKPYPDWRLDNPVIDCRALFWMVRAFGFDGLLHWGVNQWSGISRVTPIPTMRADWPSASTRAAADDAAAADDDDDDAFERGLPFLPPSEWNPATYGAGSGLEWLFGDGKLLYVGSDGPIGSIRLANVRDGMEDYDYLVQAAAVDEPAATAALHTINDGERPYVVGRDPAVLLRARAALAAIITRARHGLLL
eukprot:g1813.t1